MIGSGSHARASLTRSASVVGTVPVVGSTRAFRVLTADGNSFTTATARLTYAGANVLVYIDTTAPASGFTPAQLQAFGVYFDQTLYPIDTAAFGVPTRHRPERSRDHADVARGERADDDDECQTQGYVAGFFDDEDLGGGPLDPNSNQGEIFYSIVPDPERHVQLRAHDGRRRASPSPSTFLHELQHLISFSQHVVVHQGAPEYGWLDEGLSIVAEELGSLYYEQQLSAARRAARIRRSSFPTRRRASSRIFCTTRISTRCCPTRRA